MSKGDATNTDNMKEKDHGGTSHTLLSHGEMRPEAYMMEKGLVRTRVTVETIGSQVLEQTFCGAGCDTEEGSVFWEGDFSGRPVQYPTKGGRGGTWKLEMEVKEDEGIDQMRKHMERGGTTAVKNGGRSQRNNAGRIYSITRNRRG